MKSNILKHSGLTEKQFLAKYKSKQDFENSKEGKAILAKCGVKIPKAQTGITKQPVQGLDLSGMMKGLNLSATPDQVTLEGLKPTIPGGEAGFDFAGAIGGAGNIGKSIGNFISARKAQKKEMDRWNQAEQLTGVQLDAINSDNSINEIASQRQDNYFRPEQALIDNNQLFPQQGVGTNINVAKYGDKIPQANMGFMSNLMGQNPADASGGTPWGAIGGVGSGVAEGIMGGQDAGSQFGGDMGKTLGNAILPGVGGAAGEIIGTVAGGLLDRRDDKIERYKEGAQKNMGKMMMSTMNPTKNQFSAYAEKGTSVPTYAMGGDLEALWGGGVEDVAYNPHMGHIAKTSGNSHQESDGNGNTGVGISTNGQKVETFGGETIINTPFGENSITPTAQNGASDESKIIFGTLGLSKQLKEQAGLKDIKGNTFHSASKGLTKQNTGINKKEFNLKNKFENFEVKDIFDKSTEESLNLSYKGFQMQYKPIAENFEKLGKLQEGIKTTASQLGYKDETKFLKDFEKNKLKFKAPLQQLDTQEAQYGSNIPKAEDGVTDPKPKVFKSKKAAEEYAEANPSYKVVQRNGKWGAYAKGTDASSEKTKEETFIEASLRNKNLGPAGGGKIKDPEAWKKGIIKKIEQEGYTVDQLRDEKWIGDTTEFDKYIPKATVPEGKELVEKDGKWGYIDIKETEKSIAGTADDFIPIESPKATTEPVDYKRQWWMDVANQALPFLRPSDAEDLDPRQLSGEMFSMANNQLRPVQAQQYYPQLDSPYDISLQDQRNQVVSGQRSQQRMLGYNPAAQANLDAMSNEAVNKINAEEFRMNQAKRDQVFTGNRRTLNDAQLKNLDISDRQYGRQEQAFANTKEASQLALNSMSDKYAKNRLENRQLQTMENMYNYRFGDDFRAQNWNGFQQFNMPQVADMQGQQRIPTEWDADGNPTKYQLQQTTAPKQPSLSTQGINRNAQKGTKIKTRNGSIVRALKTI